MNAEFQSWLGSQIQTLKDQNLYKIPKILESPAGGRVRMNGKEVVNLSSNNYLGLANHPNVKEAALAAIEKWGVGAGAVRWIGGTMSVHEELEERLAKFKHTEAVLVFTGGFTANSGCIPAVLTDKDVVISDELNHASIIDGVRLCKAKRFRYKNRDMADLEAQLIAADAAGARFKLIATDGVFSMDGFIAPLKEICDLADKYHALVMVDDSHAVGFLGKRGRGTHEYCDVIERIDILTGTLGKALGGASGGYTSGRKEIVEVLRQRSRPYLFSNTLAPVIAGASLATLRLLEDSTDLRDKLEENTRFFRKEMTAAGFEIAPGEHPIVPVMLGDAALATRFADAMLAHGVYVIGFCYPVVPQGKARIRTQISAAHSRDELERAVAAFVAVKGELGI